MHVNNKFIATNFIELLFRRVACLFLEVFRTSFLLHYNFCAFVLIILHCYFCHFITTQFTLFTAITISLYSHSYIDLFVAAPACSGIRKVIAQVFTCRLLGVIRAIRVIHIHMYEYRNLLLPNLRLSINIYMKARNLPLVFVKQMHVNIYIHYGRSFHWESG